MRPSGMTMWLRKTPSNVAPIPSSAVRDRSLRESVLNSTRFGAERLEARASAGAASPRGSRRVRWAERRDPGPADLEPAVLGHDGHVAAAADRRGRRRARWSRTGPRAGVGVGERGLAASREAGLVHRPGDVQLPQARVERDLGQLVEVVWRSGSRRTMRPRARPARPTAAIGHGPDGSGRPARLARTARAPCRGSAVTDFRARIDAFLAEFLALQPTARRSIGEHAHDAAGRT